MQRNADGNRCANTLWMRWAKLLVGVLCVWLFIFVIAPCVREYKPIGEMLDFVHENDIDASALFYTEVEAFSEAELAVREAMKRK